METDNYTFTHILQVIDKELKKEDMEMIDLIAEEMIKNEDAYVTVPLSPETVKLYGIKTVVDSTIDSLGNAIKKIDINKKATKHNLKIILNEDELKITFAWYQKKRDKKFMIKNGEGWCDGCEKFKPFADVKVCGKCKCSRYCSRECQVADWKKHKKVCEKKN